MHESRMSDKVAIAQSSRHGVGIVAVKDIRAGETVLVWGGAGYTDRVGADTARQNGLPVMQWDDNVFSYATDAGDWQDPFRINHSCNPNCWMDGAFSIVTRCDVKQGEELTIDYALWEFDEDWQSNWNCRCGSIDCRGTVKGTDWKNPRLRARYRGHFSPLIQRMILAENPPAAEPEEKI